MTYNPGAFNFNIGGLGAPVDYGSTMAPVPFMPSALTGTDGLAGMTPAGIGGYSPGANNSSNYTPPAAGLGNQQQQAAPMTTGGYIGAGIAGLQTLGNLWMGFKQMKLANKSFKFNKQMAQTNLANTMRAYNTSLGDRARSRGFTEGQSQSQIDAYVADNRARKGA